MHFMQQSASTHDTRHSNTSAVRKALDHPKKLDAAFEAGAALADGFKEQIPAGVAVAVPVLGVCKNAYDARMAVIEHDQVAMVSSVAGGAANILDLGLAFHLFGHYSTTLSSAWLRCAWEKKSM